MSDVWRLSPYEDALALPLALAGELSDDAYGIELRGTAAKLEYGYVDASLAVREVSNPMLSRGQSVVMRCSAEITLSEADVAINERGVTSGDADLWTYTYLVVVTGTTGSPHADTWVQWIGLRHLVGNVFHAVGWMPWAKGSDEEMGALLWGEPYELHAEMPAATPAPTDSPDSADPNPEEPSQ